MFEAIYCLAFHHASALFLPYSVIHSLSLISPSYNRSSTVASLLMQPAHQQRLLLRQAPAKKAPQTAEERQISHRNASRRYRARKKEKEEQQTELGLQGQQPLKRQQRALQPMPLVQPPGYYPLQQGRQQQFPHQLQGSSEGGGRQQVSFHPQHSDSAGAQLVIRQEPPVSNLPPTDNCKQRKHKDYMTKSRPEQKQKANEIKDQAYQRWERQRHQLDLQQQQFWPQLSAALPALPPSRRRQQRRLPQHGTQSRMAELDRPGNGTQDTSQSRQTKSPDFRKLHDYRTPSPDPPYWSIY